MKFLIAVGSKEYSEPTLRVGMQIAKAANAEVTIVYVGEQVSAFTSHEVRLAQENFEKWEFDRPGVEVLEWAFNFLADNNYITPTTIETGFPRNTLVQTGGSRNELFLPGTVCSQVKLILRSGEIISELRDEVNRGHFDVTIIGGSQKRRMAHDLIQYIDSSIFVVNQFDPKKKYRLLLPVNDSMGTHNAVKFSVGVSEAFKIPIDILTVSRKEKFGAGYRGAAEKSVKFLRRAGIKAEIFYKVGEAADVIKETAADKYIIIMGVSHKNPIAKFFKGSKPVKVMDGCKCPILIVK